MENCLFCKIVAGAIPATLVYEGPDAIAFRDINPQAPTHILVVPRRHVDSLHDSAADPALLGDLLTTVRTIAEAEGLGTSGYRVAINTGPDAGQSVAHLHLHLLGGRQLAWPPG